jgi:copper chaperone CopZ
MFSTTIKAQTKTDQERVYIKIEIKGMACPYCAFGMEKELKKVSGVENVEIELKEGLAYISTPINQKPSKESLEKIIVDGGFTVGEIEYSNKPFIIKKDKDN